MSSVTGRLGLLCVAVGLFAANAAAQQEPTYQMRIVRLNDTPIDPFVTTINANPGDDVWVEVFASEWSPNGEALRTWQIQLDGDSLVSGIRGSIRPKRGQRPCDNDFDCLDLNRQCLNNTCGGDPDGLEAGVIIDKFRVDWIFSGRDDLIALDLSTDAVRLASTLFSAAQSPTYGPLGDINQPSYVGTLVLRVDDLACGDFNISLNEDGSATKMVSSENLQPIEPLTIEGITIRTVPLRNCSCTELLVENDAVVADPPHCWVDSRQPSQPNGGNLANIDSMDIRFNCPNTAGVADPANFTLVVDGVPIGGGITSVQGNTPSAAWVRIGLANPIDAGAWSCVRYNATGQEACAGSLPGDADQDLTSEMATDLVRLIGCVEGVVTCELIACDMDRSGACAPSDILRGIDLYNGGDAFAVWDGAFLSPCN